MPPSPTAAAQRLTEPERTSPAANTPGRLVSIAPGARSIFCHAEDCDTFAPVRTNPLSSRSISLGSQLVQGDAPGIENTAAVFTARRAPLLVSSSSTDSNFLPPLIRLISVW